ncbi:MAG: ABC transporter substrate-binding protein [Eubacteriaceae bacterium]|jgi:peptide/nickel transport system substrate-binding protein|nr:ABC transporter substrate-binding protein [Eubacteriaceae bacterium]
MKKTFAKPLAALALAAAMLFSSCEGGGSGDGESPTGNSSPKVVNMVMFSSPDGFISYLGGGGLYTNMAGNLVFEGLTRVDNNFNLLPGLADSWEISADSLTYTLHLNEQAKWHDGTPFTSADVAFTYKLLLNKDFTGSGSPYLINIQGAEEYKSGAAQDVPGIQIIDPHTIKIVMSTPYAPFLEYNAGTICILPEHLLKDVPIADIATADVRFNPVGTGPAVFNKYVTDQYVEYDMNKDYYRGTPKFDKLILKIMTSDAALVAFENGELDLTTNTGLGTMPASDLESLKAIAGVKVETYATTTVQFISVNVANPVLSDVRFRQAMNYAIDKKAIIDNLISGVGTVSYTSIPEFSPYYDASVARKSYDPEKAKALLNEMGWDTSKELVLFVPKGQVVRERMAPLIQSYLKDVGVTVKLEFGEFATLVAEITKGNYDLAMFGTGAAIIDPNAAYFNFFHSVQTRDVGGWNMGHYKNEEFDRLLEEGTATTDVAARKEIYNRIQAIEADESAFVNIYFESAVGVLSNRMKNVILSAAGPCWNIVEWDLQ